jgi:hypothetical protein
MSGDYVSDDAVGQRKKRRDFCVLVIEYIYVQRAQVCSYEVLLSSNVNVPTVVAITTRTHTHF